MTDSRSHPTRLPRPADGDIWAPDLTRRDARRLQERLDSATEEMLRDWQAARMASDA